MIFDSVLYIVNMFFILTIFSTILKWSKWSTWCKFNSHENFQSFEFYCCWSFCPSLFRSDSFSAVRLLSFVKLHFVFSCFSLLCDPLIDFARIISGMFSQFFSSIVWVNFPNSQIQFLSVVPFHVMFFDRMFTYFFV